MPKKDQRSRPFVTPPRSEIPGISRMHVTAMLASNEGQAWGDPWMRNLVLRTVGRRSGRQHDVALPYWEDDDDQRYVVASFAGAAHHPAWFLNLSDRSANREVWVKEQESTYWADAQVLDGEDHERIWEQLTLDRPYYNDYQAKCERRIPLIRLVPTRPG